MATFINIKVQDKNCWMLKISDYNDVMNYIRFFSGRAWAGAKTCIERIQSLGEISHLGGDPEAIIMKVMAECSADENGHYEFHPMKQTSNLIEMKLKLLMDMVGDGKEVIINENGGCCDLPSFLSIHKATISKEIISDEIVFPKELDKSKTYKLLILENDNEIDYDYRTITNFRNDKIIIDKLKTRTKEQIFFYLETCEEIITKTTFVNQDQTLSFMTLFSHLKNKTIKIISDNTPDFILKIEKDEKLKQLYATVMSRNKIIFYNSSLEITKDCMRNESNIETI